MRMYVLYIPVTLHPYFVYPYHGVIPRTVLEAANSIFDAVYDHGVVCSCVCVHVCLCMCTCALVCG